MSAAITVRSAEPADVPLLFSMIVELADYERAADRVTGSEALLEQALFGPDRSVEALIAELDHSPAGFALFFGTFSTWLCRSGVWLEDLYVRPEHRRAGVGGVLLSHLAQLALRRGCGRLEWSALNWNTPALDFYQKLGAERLHAWQGFRLEGEAMDRVAGGAGDSG